MVGFGGLRGELAGVSQLSDQFSDEEAVSGGVGWRDMGTGQRAAGGVKHEAAAALR